MINMLKERALLQRAFEESYAKTKDNEFCEQTALSKLKHSFQVLGMGNYLLRHEPLFENKATDYIADCKAVCLLHDIGRFRELEFLFNDMNSHHNHALYSYQVLKKEGYTNLRILLPIKHHTYDISLLETDDEFINISDSKFKTEIVEIYKLIKDADKLANLYIAKTRGRIFHDLLSKKILKRPLEQNVSENVWSSFSRYELVKTADVECLNDRMLQLIAFIFDFNFKSSFQLVTFHGLIDYLLNILAGHNLDQERQHNIENMVKTYIAERLK